MPETKPFAPILVTEIDLDFALPTLSPQRPDDDDGAGAPYGEAHVLVRLHGAPVGLVDLDLSTGDVCPQHVAQRIWAALGRDINRHLVDDGLPTLERIPPDGVNGPQSPRCLSERERFLAGGAPTLSVIIPTRENPERLRRCLTSIFTCEYPADLYEVLIVDNRPVTTGVRDLFEETRDVWPRLRYVREDTSGSASARNTGVQHAIGQICVFTDDDVVVNERWLTEIARGYQAAPDVAAVSGLLLPMELATAPQVWFEQYGGFGRGFDRQVYDLDEHRVQEDPLYPFAAGVFGTANNFSFRRDKIHQIGGFDPALGNGTPALGGVDSEIVLRLILGGHRLVYEPKAYVYHQHRRDYEALQRQIYNYGVGLTAYMTKTVIYRPAVLLRILRRVPIGVRFALDPNSSKNENKRSGYPADLTKLELRGMLYGPVAYVRSRRRYGKHKIPLPDRSRP